MVGEKVVELSKEVVKAIKAEKYINCVASLEGHALTHRYLMSSIVSFLIFPQV